MFVRYQLGKNRNISGVGGKNLKNENVRLIYEYKDLSTFGFSNSVFSFIKNFLMYRKIARAIFKLKPKILIAVAYPGINLLLCRYAKNLGIKTIYLLPPQIWAWGTFRKYFIKKWVDMVISVFPFEYQFYGLKKISTIFWQNPLFELLKDYKKKDSSRCIGLMPGSRLSEIKRNLPVVIELLKNLEDFKDFDFVLILHQDIPLQKRYGLIPEEFKNKIKIVSSDQYKTMCGCTLMITCSGTASLETWILGIPQIFF